MKKLWKPALLLAAIAVMVIGVLGSGAWFTDTANTSQSTIQAGTLELTDGGISTFNLGDTSNMAPGDITNEVQILIKNDGTLPLGWYGGMEFDNMASPLMEALYIEYAKMEFLAPGGGTWESTDNFIDQGVGAGTYASAFTPYATLPNSKFGKISLKAWDNNNLMTGDLAVPYEHMGALKPGFAYRLTLKLGFAPLAGDAYQDAGPLKISFKVVAAQLKGDALTSIGGTAAALTWMNEQIAKQ